MKFKRVLSAFLAVFMVTSSLGNMGTVRAAEKKEESAVAEVETIGDVTLKEVEKNINNTDLYAQHDNEKEQIEVLPEEDEMVRVLIMVEGDSVIENDAKASLNLYTEFQMNTIEAKQDRVISKIERTVLEGEDLNVRYQYSWLLNGIAAEVPYGMIDEIEEISGVEKVILQPMYEVADGEQNDHSRTIADGGMIGREDTWASGYTGKGIKIAIIDTGLDDDHQNFQAMSEDKLTEESATKETVGAVLDRLNAASLYPNLSVDQVYRSNKVAFGFNYVDKSTVINHSTDSQGDHGTHVAGIAAANDLGNGEAVGVAPDAQLYVMKIFGANGGAYAEDILASVEDALLLGADVINMSLGSNAGFTSGGEEVDAIYARVAETNTILAVAAGNSTTAGTGNMWGTDSNLTSNPDNSIISSPATYQNVTSVASIENVKIQSNYIEVNGKQFGYIEGNDGINNAISVLAGNEYDYAMVDNCGQTLEDFTNAGVEGKIAVVQRGITNFSSKHEFAQEAGAVACIIYNNTSGTLNMALTDGTGTIPCVSVTLAAGEYLAAAKEESADAAIYVAKEKTLIPNDAGGQMSDFSSWGAAPDLNLEPDISGPGGNIYSTLDGGTYGIMSGTSMATPNVAGISALVMQYAKTTNPDMADDELHDYVNSLLISTSEPVVYDEETGITYSPRQQGSGLANAYSATKTKAYLSVDGNEMPEAELYDDVERTGNYSFTYHVNNFGDRTIYYDLSTNAQTEDVDVYDEYQFMSLTPRALSAATSENSDSMVYTYDYDGNDKTDTHDARELYLVSVAGTKDVETGAEFRYEVNAEEGSDRADVQAYLDALVGKESEADLADQVLKVEAGSTADVTVSVSLSEADREYFDTYYKNGGYVEGFTNLTARSTGDVDLSMPYLGFYGDWTEAPIIDDGYYWDESDTSNASQYWNIIWTSIQGSDWLPGLNPYLEDEPFDQANMTMSPNDDGITDGIEDIYLSLLRNANTVEISYENAETGEVYYDETYDKVQKTYYYSSAGSMLPFIQAQYAEEMYGFTDQNGEALPNNTKVLMKAKATLDYDKHESNNERDVWEVAFTVDTEAPQVLKAEVVKEDGKQYLDLTFRDNQKVAAVCFLNKAGAVVKSKYAVDSKAGEEVTERYDITGYGNEFMLVLGDYAVNETYYEVETTDNIPEVNTELLYAYRVATDTIYDDTLYGWVAVDPENRSEEGNIVVEAQDSEYYVDYSLQAAEYIDGYVLAVNSGGQLVYLTPGVWDDRTVIADYGVEIKDIAYDPVDQVLYGYTGGSDGTYEIVKIDILTGEMTGLGALYTWWYARPFALTCDAEGRLYGIGSDGLLKEIDKTTGLWKEEVLLDTGLTPMNVQSMTYNQKENSIYWAAYLNDETSHLYKIDLDQNYEMTLVGSLDDNPELNGLIYLDDRGFDIPEETAAALAMSCESVEVLSGTSTDLSVSATPWYANTGTLIWSSSDDSIASVDIKGTVTGKKEGTATITVASKEFPELTASCEILVVQPKSDLYGFTIGSNAGYANQWLSFNTGRLKAAEAVSDLSWVTYSAAEYYDGSIYAYNDSTEFYKIDPTNYVETKITNANSTWSMKDMAFDYSTGYMFGIATQAIGDGMTYLVHIDLQTGMIEQVGDWPVEDEKGGQPIALAISTEGTIYMITETGYLCECTGDRTAVGGNYGDGGFDGGIDGGWPLTASDDDFDLDFGFEEETESLALRTIGVTKVSHIAGLTSMVYDHNTGDMYYSYANGTDAEQIALIDQINGTALTLGSVAGGSQFVGLYAVPEEDKIPERPQVDVTGITATTDTLNMVTGMSIAAPVNVQPLNATDRTINWNISEEGIISIEDNVITALSKGSVVVTAEVAGYETEFVVRVYESAGIMKGFVVYDFMYEETNIWATFKDSDLTTGTGLANAEDYVIDAAEYYDGKVYAYDNMNSQYLVLNSKSTKYEVEKRIKMNHPDMADMAFDYSEGVMYALSCVRNVDTNTSLYAVNIEDGSYYKIGEQGVTLKALTCSTDGILYGVDSNGSFYRIDKRTGAEEYLFDTGYSANVYQSMAYDHNTGNIYWAQCKWDLDFGSEANLILIDAENQVSMVLGQIGSSGCQVTGLYIDPKGEMNVGTPEIEAVKLSSSNVMMSVGESQKISAFTEPLSAAMSNTAFTYVSSDENVVTVDEAGNITAVGVGTAEVIVSYADKQGICEVTVMDDTVEFYILNPNGIETSPVLKPAKINDRILLSDYTDAFRIEKATLNTDGYFYAVGTDGYLWKFTADMGTIEKIGEAPVMEQLDNLSDFAWYSNPSFLLRSLVANVFNGKLYALVYVSDEWGNYCSYLYEVNAETGAASVVMQVPWDVTLPTTMTFDGEDSMIIYDGNLDYIYRVSLTYGTAEALVWTQGTVVATEDIAMYYSKNLNRVFMTTTNDSPYVDTHTIDLYVLDLESKNFEKLGQASYNQEVKGFVMLEGITLAEGENTVEEVLEELAEEVTEEVTETEDTVDEIEVIEPDQEESEDEMLPEETVPGEEVSGEPEISDGTEDAKDHENSEVQEPENSENTETEEPETSEETAPEFSEGTDTAETGVTEE